VNQVIFPNRRGREIFTMHSLKETEEGRALLRLVNRRVNDLRRHVASRVEMYDGRLTIQFEPAAGGAGVFCVQLGGVVGFVDHGLLFQPLTAGLLWDMAGPFGREHGLDVGREETEGLIELRLDYQAEELHCRFQAVARTAAVWDGLAGKGPAHTTLHKEAMMSTNPVTWETISGYITEMDVEHMKNITGGALDLSDCESVQHWAKQIYVALSNKVMPPGGWPDNQIADFKSWLDAGAQCPTSADTDE
jgi:hypothetical protein